ncbi:hypothetical protein CIK83_15895 [Vibrio casei]|uniref:Uncharacterized protein n=1 Tax=Vibrio casei TaxID=673372 RepID=A0A368LJE7_9VIBR|nr:hypothetical protein CIK83_15895 [Vibrio casei]
MKISLIVTLYVICGIFNSNIAANNHIAMFSGSFYYGVSSQYSILITKTIPVSISRVSSDSQKVFALQI